jgi:prevent-host-death family protein
VVVVTVGVRELRSNLRDYLRRAAAGEEVVVTDRGRPLARIVGAGWQSTYDRLVAEGVVTPPARPRGPIRPEETFDVQGDKTLTDYVLEDRHAGS